VLAYFPIKSASYKLGLQVSVPYKVEIVCAHTFTEWIADVMEYNPFKSKIYDVGGTLSKPAKCAGILLRCYISGRE
jgi:hypothetical protein